MRKLLFSFIILTLLIFIVNNFSHNSVKKIKADYIDIGLGQSLYSGIHKVDKETVQSLVDAYNQIEYIGHTNEKINYQKAISITFIYNDQISGSLVIDDKGIFQTSNRVENYQIESTNDIYDRAKKIYEDLKKHNRISN